MKKGLIASLFVFLSTFSIAQIGVNIGIGPVYANKSSVGMTSHVEAFYRFKAMQEFPQFQQQATFGFMYSPFNEKSIYSAKYGIAWENIVMNFGAVLINQDLYTNEGSHYMRVHKTFLTGVEYNLKRKKPTDPYLYIGGDYVDKDFYLKFGIKFVSNH